MKALVALIAGSALFAGVIMTSPAHAASANFRPVTAHFGGHSSLSLPPNIALELNVAGTIEFWVAAQWAQNPGYDPAIMAYSGAQGPRFAFHIAGDRKSLGVYVGKYFASVPFDFSDSALHYVAIVEIGDTLAVHIDNQVRATLGFGFAELPVTQFTVGSIGGYSPFVGEIGQIRIWNAPLDDDVLEAYQLRPLNPAAGSPHPDIDSLAGMSTFANPETGGFIFFGDTGPLNLSEARPTIDDSDTIATPLK